jgi:hypothetical protein
MRSIGLASLAIFTLTGCASIVPQYDVPRDQSGGPTVETIRLEILCELGRIANGPTFTRYVAESHDVQAAIILSLDVTDDGALAPKLAPSPAYVAGFAFNAGINLEQSREQNFQAQLTYSLSEIAASFRDPNVEAAACGHRRDTNLAGDLGLEQAWKLGMTALTDVDWSAKPAVGGAFGGIVTFTVKKQLTATGPTWSFAQYAGPGGFLSGYENNLDKLTFAFVRGPKAKKALLQQTAAQFLNTVQQGGLANSLSTIQSNH